MKRTIMATCAAAALALGLGLSVSAQSTSSGQNQDQMNHMNKMGTVTVTGCLQKTDSGGYWLTNPRMSKGMQSKSGTSGMQSDSQNQSTNQNPSMAQKQSGMQAMDAKAWNLQGDNDEWDSHVGQTVQITGNPQSTMSSDTMKMKSGSGQMSNGQEMQARDIDVQSVKVVSSSCQQPKR